MTLTIIDSKTQQPIAGIPVWVWDTGIGVWQFIGTTDANGQITVPTGYPPPVATDINPRNDPAYNPAYEHDKRIAPIGDASIPLSPSP